MSALGESLWQARRDRDLSVRQAATQARVSPSTWSAIENDRRGAGTNIRPLLEAWLQDSPQAFPPRRIDAALDVLEQYRYHLDPERVTRLQTIAGGVVDRIVGTETTSHGVLVSPLPAGTVEPARP